jgi:hypothetical protein
MPAVDHPLGAAASLPGQVAALRKVVKDLSVNKTQSPAIFAVGAGGLSVVGPSTLTGGVTGPIVATGPLSGSSLSVSGSISGLALTGTSLDVGAGSITGATVTTTGAASIGAGVTISTSAALGGDVFIPNRTAVVSGYFGLWVNSDGRIGISSSGERYKQEITARAYTLEQIELIAVVSYRLKTAVAEIGDAARVEVGVIAEQLITAGLAEFVQFNPDGTTETVAYERLALVALVGVQVLAGRVRSIEARLTAGGL